MTYSLDFRKQVLKSSDEGMTFVQAVDLYNISPTTIQKWKKRIHSKTTREIKPHKIEDDALIQDVKNHPDDYHHERARRFNCSASGICEALKRLNMTQKKDTRASKSVSNQASDVSKEA